MRVAAVPWPLRPCPATSRREALELNRTVHCCRPSWCIPSPHAHGRNTAPLRSLWNGLRRDPLARGRGAALQTLGPECVDLPLLGPGDSQPPRLGEGPPGPARSKGTLGVTGL